MSPIVTILIREKPDQPDRNCKTILTPTYKKEEILKLLHDKGNVMFVTTAGNDAEELGREIQHYPAQMADPNNKFHVPNLIVVGATDADGLEAKFSQNADWMTTFGPGSGVWMPDATTKDGIIHGAGTSFGELGYGKCLEPAAALRVIRAQ